MSADREALREIERAVEWAAGCGYSANKAREALRALLAEPDPTPIRGRWTLVANDRTGEVFDVIQNEVVGRAMRDAGWLMFKVVPVPDEQAIERAAQTAWDRDEARAASEETRSIRYRARPWTEAHDLDRVEYLEDARAVLAAALEQSDAGP